MLSDVKDGGRGPPRQWRIDGDKEPLRESWEPQDSGHFLPVQSSQQEVQATPQCPTELFNESWHLFLPL